MIARHKKMINLALELARDNPGASGAKCAAILSLGNQKFFGFNSMKSHPFALRYSKNDDAIYFHAETAAIWNALNLIDPRDLKRATMYVARVAKPFANGSWESALAQPCVGCARCIAESGINSVYYTTQNNGIIKL